MKTVKEISNLTGISVRTLHYYDEIHLLKPSVLSEAGYRLYDDKALETLQQILFFKELDLPLKQIKIILEDPGLDKRQLLSSQKRMLELHHVSYGLENTEDGVRFWTVLTCLTKLF